MNPRLPLAAVLLLVPTLAACPMGKDKRKVRVSVVAILASETDDKVEKKLEAIAAEVKKMRPALKGFKMVNLSCKSLELNVANLFDLVEGQKAEVSIKSAADKMDLIQLKVKPPKMGWITYSTPCGKFLPILTPFKTDKGEQLLIAIRVQPCNGK